MNDIPIFVTEAYIDLYADDATMHTLSKKSTVVENKLQVGAQDIKSWCLSHKMFIHIEKTSVMLTGARQTLSHTDPIAIYLDNELLKLVDNQKLLGITIDNTLSWATQVDNVCQKTNNFNETSLKIY